MLCCSMFAWSESLVRIQQFMGCRCFVIAARPPLFSALIRCLNKARGSFLHSPQYNGGKQMFSRVLPETIRFFRRADYILLLVCSCSARKDKNGVFGGFLLGARIYEMHVIKLKLLYLHHHSIIWAWKPGKNNIIMSSAVHHKAKWNQWQHKLVMTAVPSKVAGDKK